MKDKKKSTVLIVSQNPIIIPNTPFSNSKNTILSEQYLEY